MILSSGLLTVGCSDKSPKKNKKNRNYLEVVIHSKDMGENIKVGENMNAVLTQLKMYEISNDAYPDSLDDIDIDQRQLVGADGETKLVYIKPATNASGSTIIMYDPVGLDKKHYVLTKQGVSKISTSELNEMIGNDE